MRKRNMLLKKHKKLLFEYKSLSNFKEPVAFLIRRNSEVEFYEDVKGDEFKFVHSDGDERTIYLSEKGLKVFKYGNKTFRGYILHEDIPYPLPQDPLISTKMTRITLEKVLNDIKKWKEGEKFRNIGVGLKEILIGGAILLGAYALYKMLVPSSPVESTVVEVAKNVSSNITNTSNLTIPKNVEILGGGVIWLKEKLKKITN